MTETFTLRVEYEAGVSQMPDNEAGKLFKAILTYASGKMPNLKETPYSVQLLFPMMIKQIDMEKEKESKTKRARANAGKAGANSRWQTMTGMANIANDGNDSKNDFAIFAINSPDFTEENEEEKEENGKERTKEKDKGEIEEDKEELNTIVGIYSEVVKEKEKGVPSPLSNNKGTPEKTKKPPDPKADSPLFKDPLVREAWEEYRQMRLRIRKPFAGMAETRRVNDLEQLSHGNADLAVKILNQSVDNCWVGLFALKEEPKSRAERYREEWENA